MEGARRRDILKRAVGGPAASCALAGCTVGGNSTTTARTQIRVGSKNFAENRILGYMSIATLRANTELSVIDLTSYGGSAEVWAGLTSGDIDTYWEYTGTQYIVLEPEHETAPKEPQALYEAVRRDARAQGVKTYSRAPVDNSFVLVTTESWAERTGVQTLGDLAAYVNAGNTGFKLALGEDFYRRADGWSELTDHYGFEAEPLAALEEQVTTIPIGISYDLLARGDVAVGMGFATDPQIKRRDLHVLADDRSYFPPYNPVPMVDADSATSTSVGTYLDQIGPAIDGLSEMRELNGRVVLDGKSPQTVAREFLDREGLI